MKPLSTLSLLTAALLGGVSAHAALLITYSTQPQYESGPDDAGITGATLTFNATVNQATYSSAGGFGPIPLFPYASVSSVSLTVSGSSVPGNNGTFNLTSDFAPFVASPNDGFGYGFPLAGSDPGGFFGLYFTFGPNSVVVQNLAIYGPNITSPAPGDAILASHFEGMVVNGDSGSYQIGGALFQIPNTTVHASITPVPEPAEYAALTGMALAGFDLWRRRQA